jgi:hypothetical protein
MRTPAQRIAFAFRFNASVGRVVERYKAANQPPGARQKAKKLTQPINKPKGIDRDVLKENGVTKTEGEDTIKSQSRDIQPKDVFTPTPDHTGVLSLVQSGKDLSKAIDKQVPKDKGFDVVHNLSQYLIETDGNGGKGTSEGR